MAGARTTPPKKARARQMMSPSPSPSKVGKTSKASKVSKTAATAIEEAATSSNMVNAHEGAYTISKPDSPASPKSRSVSPPLDNLSNPTPKAARGRNRSSKASQEWSFTHIPPRQDERRKNGRYEGRNLVIWTRPRMMEKLVLHMQYELARHKIDVPWDAIAHRLHPGSSGSAIQQYLNRMRPGILAEGHLIPPPLPKPGSRLPVDPTIRGYVREDMDGPDRTTMRPVPFTEPMDDRKFNLPDAFELGKMGDIVSTPLPAPSTPKSRKSVKASVSGGRSRKGKATIKEESPDPADLDSDADYDPRAKASATRRRSSRAKQSKTYIDEAMSDIDIDDGVSAEDATIAEAAAKIESGGEIAHDSQAESYIQSRMDTEGGVTKEGNECDSDDENNSVMGDSEGAVEVIEKASDAGDDGGASESDEFEPSNEVKRDEEECDEFQSSYYASSHFQVNDNAVMFNSATADADHASLPTFPTTPTLLTTAFVGAANVNNTPGHFGQASQPFNHVGMASSSHDLFFSPQTVSPSNITTNAMPYMPSGGMGYYDGSYAPSDDEENFQSMVNARDISFTQARFLHQNNRNQGDWNYF